MSETSRLVLKGFFQGSELVDGVPGPLKNYLSIENEATGKILNIDLTEENLRDILALAYPDGTTQEEPEVDQEQESHEPESEPEPSIPDSVMPE